MMEGALNRWIGFVKPVENGGDSFRGQLFASGFLCGGLPGWFRSRHGITIILISIGSPELPRIECSADLPVGCSVDLLVHTSFFAVLIGLASRVSVGEDAHATAGLETGATTLRYASFD